MSISIQCIQCGRRYQFPDDKGGKRFKCRECDAVVNIPLPQSSGEDEWMDDDSEDGSVGVSMPARAARSQKSTGKGNKKKRKRMSKRSGAPAVYISLGVGVLAISVIVGIFLLTRGGDSKPGDNSTNENVAANDSSTPNFETPPDNTNPARSATNSKVPNSSNTSGSTSSGGSSAKESPPTVAKPKGLTQYFGVDEFRVAKRGCTILTYRRRSVARTYRGKKIPGREAEIVIWNWKTGERITRFTTPEYWDHFALAPNDGLVASVAGGSRNARDEHNEIVVWDAKTGKRLKVIKRTSSPAPKIKKFLSVAFSYDGTAIYSCGGWNTGVGNKGATRLHQFARIDVASGKIAVFHAESFNPMSPLPLAASPVEDIIAVGVVQRGANGKSAGFIEFRAGPTGEVKRKIALSGYPANVSYTADGRRLVVLLSRGKLVVVNTQTGAIETTTSPPMKRTLFGVPPLPVSPDGRYAHFGSLRSEKLIRELWDLKTKRGRQLNKGISRQFDFLPDGRAIFKDHENSMKLDGAALYRLRIASPEELMQGAKTGVAAGSR